MTGWLRPAGDLDAEQVGAEIRGRAEVDGRTGLAGCLLLHRIDSHRQIGVDARRSPGPCKLDDQVGVRAYDDGTWP